MGKITEFGFEVETLAQWRLYFEAMFQSVLGEDVSLDPSTVVGRWIRHLGILGAKWDEDTQYVAGGLNLFQAVGRQLTDYATLAGIPFVAGSRSTVNVNLTGVAGTVIPQGSEIRNDTGAVFATTADVIIGAGGTGTVLTRAVTIGPVQAAANSLTTIVDVVIGWDTVTNPTAAILGKNEETEAEWVTKYNDRVAVHGHGSVESVQARVGNVDGVEQVVVLHNDEVTEVTNNGFTQPANSYSVILSGNAEDADIAKAIDDTAPPGIPSNGSESATVNGSIRRWTPATETEIAIEIATVIQLGTFPADGNAQMRRSLLNYMSNQSIGQGIDTARLQAVIAEIVGHTVNTFNVTLANGNALTDTTAVTLWTLVDANITITLTS